MLKNSKFVEIYEGMMTRYRIGSFLVGDQVHILKSIKSSQEYKSLPESEQEIIDRFIKDEANGDIILKIVSLNNWGGQGRHVPQSEPLTFEIGVECGGGRYIDVLALPGNFIKYIERIVPDVNNLPAQIAPNNVIDFPDDRLRELTDDEATGKDEKMIPENQPKQSFPGLGKKISGQGV